MMNPPKKSNNISKRKRELMEIAARMKSELGDDSDDGKPDCDAQPKPQDSTAAKAKTECILAVHGLPFRVMRSGKRLMLFADTGNVQTFIELFKKLKMSEEDSEPEPRVQQEESWTSVVSWRCDRRCYIVRFVDELGTPRTKETQPVNYCDAAGKALDEQALLEARIRANIQANKLWNLLGKSGADRFDE